MNPKTHDVNSFLFQFALFALASMTVLGGTLIAPSLPGLQEHFAATPHIETLSKLILTMPALFIVLAAPVAGYLLDHYGRLKFVLPAVALWSAGGALGYFAHNIWLVLLSRALLGVATAFIMAGANALLGDYYTGAARQKALAKQGFFQAFGGACMLILGGFLAHVNWHYPFLVYLSGFGILALCLVYLYEPPRHGAESSADSALIESITESATESAQDSPTKSESAKESAAKITKPNADSTNPHKFRLLPLLPVLLVTFFSMSMFYTMPTQIPFYIVGVLGENDATIGYFMACASVATAFSSLFYARLRARLRLYTLYILGFGMMFVGFFLLYAAPFYIATIAALILIGVALGIILVNNSSWLLSIAHESSKARAFGMLSSFLFMAQFLSPFFSQPIVSLGGLKFMFLTIALSAAAGVLVFLKLSLKDKNER